VQHAVTEETTSAQIARLERELAAERNRADIAEEQLRRVHIAVRAFKQSQTTAKLRREELMRSARAHAEKIVREAKTEAGATSSSGPAGPSSLYSSWLVADPGLDDRLDDYLQSEFEPDRSREWMLSE
jgi:cell division septum initiation protein DivIVA